MALRAKFVLLFLTSVVLVAGVLSVALIYNNETYTSSSRELSLSFDNQQRLQKISVAFKTQVQEWKDILLRGQNPEALAKHTKGFMDKSQLIADSAKELMPFLSADDQELLTKFREAHSDLMQHYLDAKKQFVDVETFDAASADKAVKGLDRKVLDPMEALATHLSDAVARKVTETNAKLHFLLLTSLSLAAAIAGLLAYVGWAFAARLSKTLEKTTEELSQLGAMLTLNAEEIAKASGQLTSASTEQAAAAHETSSTTEVISASAKRASENANHAIEAVQSGQEKTRIGQNAMQSMLQAITDIQSSNAQMSAAIEASNKNFAGVSNIISSIESKTKVINEIVFQTKLLSFNASVEAARAGEQGKGFAVVAQEVGNLAEMSGKASLEISQLLEQSLATVSKLVSETQKQLDTMSLASVEKIKIGESMATQCGQILQQVSEQIGEISQISNSVSSSSTEQSQGVDQIVTAVTQITQATEETARIAESASRIGENLSSQVDGLSEVIRQLEIIVKGRTSQESGSAPQQKSFSDPAPRLAA